MFMDRLNKHYISFDEGNTIIWENATPFAVSDFSIHPQLLALIDSLRKVRPLWRYKCTTHTYGTRPTMHRCYIYEGDSPLGEVWIENHWRNDTSRFFFQNERIQAGNSRNRNGRFTSKLPNAVKEIVKVFYLKTPKERSSVAFSAIHKALGAADSKSNLEYMRARHAVERAAIVWAERDWETAKALLGPALADVDLPEIANHRGDMKSLLTAYHACAGRAVRAEGNGTYLVSRVIDGGYNMVMHTDDSLPDILRGGLGLLKLVEVGTTIPNIGVRAEDNIFFVLDAEEPNDTDV